MIRAAQKYFASIPAVFIDGVLYVLVQMLTVLSTQIGTDESAKYIEAETLFWTKVVIGELAAGVLAIKMFRSTTFADHQQTKKNGTGSGDTTIITK